MPAVRAFRSLCLRPLVVVAAAAATVGCGEAAATPVGTPPLATLSGTAYDAAAATRLPERKPEDAPGLHNVFRLSERIVSGSEPHDEAALRRLAEMGIRTIVSVDGKVPDAETARKHGLRYVHVPIQYSGITDEEMRRLAKTFLDLPGPFYVHCFHGKHRGPAAAAVGRLVLDRVPRATALAEMRQWCGTSPKYEGLYLAIARGEMPTDRALASMDYDYPAAFRFRGFRHSMISVSRAYDDLEALSKHAWRADPEHPDLDADNASERLAQHFRESVGLEEVARRPADFRVWLAESAKAADDLRAALRRRGEGDPDAAKAADAAFAALGRRCDACHKPYRN